MFLIPNSNREDNAPTQRLRLREFNQCHAPAGTSAGGEFCGTGRTDLSRAMLIQPGERVDIHAVLGASGQQFEYRLFLFDPASREVIIGAAGTKREPTHAEAANAVFEGPDYDLKQRGYRHDKYRVHGYLTAQNGRLEGVQVSRIAGPPGGRSGGYDYDEGVDTRQAEKLLQMDLVSELADRLKGLGATADIDFALPWEQDNHTLGTAFPEVYAKKRKMREGQGAAHNDCHNPAGNREGGRFCSTHGSLPALQVYPRPRGSKDIPDFLKADVLAAVRAGIEVHHAQQPEPVMGLEGQIHDPLARSHARSGPSDFYDARGIRHTARRGRVYITTRGGEFEPEQEVWDDKYGYSSRRVEKDLTPEMLSDELKATVLDVVSTFRHEVGHIMDQSHTGGKIGVELAREIRAWQYAMEVSPDHRISQSFLRKGLESHAYTVFRKQALPKELTYLSRTSSWDMDETLDRIIQNELRSGVINIEAHRQARAFADKTIRALDRYGAVLRKRGIVRVPQPLDANYFSQYGPKAKVIPGPGGRSQL